MPLLSKKCYKCGNEGRFCSSDLKPVFTREKEIYEKFLGIELPNNLFRTRNQVILDGNTLFRYRIIKDELKAIEDLERIKTRIKESSADEDNIREKMLKANGPVLWGKEGEAIKFIKNVNREHEDRLKFISFSGGKDSAVTAILVKKAKIGEVPLFFVDTTIEFPETNQYIKDFTSKYDFKLIVQKPFKDFFELCKEFGPPSYWMRWCCTTQKAAPINDFYSKLGKNILSFDGVRKCESHKRANYPRLNNNMKIAKQLSAYPILNWSNLMVWLYSYYSDLPFNPMYEWGFSRIGCWVCPSISKYENILIQHAHPDLFSKWRTVLSDYAQSNNKDEDWVKKGIWKFRRVKYGGFYMITKINEEGDASDFNDKLVYHFDRELSPEMLEFIKPFGEVKRYERAFRIVSPDIAITSPSNQNQLNVESNNIQQVRLFEKALLKGLNCVGCGACIGACPNNAISVNPHFKISEKLCQHCLICCTSKYVKQSCVALQYKPNRKRIKQGVTMVETKISEGITDITTSEGNLKRFSQICKLIGDQRRALPRSKVVQLIKEQIGLTNAKVIGRHISILEKLSILENKEGMYILSSEGKVLYNFIEDLQDKNALSPCEIAFYFRMLFTHFFGQLYLLLKTIDDHKGKARDDIIIKYFENEDLKLWKKETVNENLRMFREKGKVSGFFENKFRCMEKWLYDLKFIEKTKKSLKLTYEGKKCLVEIDKITAQKKEINDEIYGIASSLLNLKPDPFDFENPEHKKNLIGLFKEAYLKFEAKLRLSDLKAIRCWICVILLTKYNIILEEKEFDFLLNALSREGVIRSVMVGRNGRPSFVTIPY